MLDSNKKCKRNKVRKSQSGALLHIELDSNKRNLQTKVEVEVSFMLIVKIFMKTNWLVVDRGADIKWHWICNLGPLSLIKCLVWNPKVWDVKSTTPSLSIPSNKQLSNSTMFLWILVVNSLPDWTQYWLTGSVLHYVCIQKLSRNIYKYEWLDQKDGFVDHLFLN